MEKSTELVITETQAMTRFNEAQKILDFNRPSTNGHVKTFEGFGQEFDGHEDLAHLNVILYPILLSVAVPLLSVSVPVLVGIPLASSFMVSAGILSFIPIFYSIRSHDGNPKHWVRHMLSNIFLTKKQKARMKQCHQKNMAHDKSWELYRLLIDKVRSDLENEGVFDKVNHSQQSQFIHITNTGHCQTLSLEEWKKALFEAPLNNDLNKSIIGQLSK